MPRDLTPRSTIALEVTGLAGATETSRYVGGTISGAPATGTFQAGDFVIALDGTIWICIGAGSPGTWQQVSGTGGGGGTGSDTPVGTIVAYYGTTAPSGWLLCDGGAIPGTYTALIALVGANTPNLKGRTLVGLDAAQTEFDVLGETGGAKTVALTTTEMPSHTHVQNGHTHTQDAHVHGFTTAATAMTNPGNSLVMGAGNPPTAYGGTMGSTAATNQSTTPTNQNTGGGGGHNNLQPYATINWIIKAQPGGGGGGAPGAGETDPLVHMGGW